MQFKEMKCSGDMVSILGFGCMRFPTTDGEIDEEKSMEMLNYAYKNGVNYYDNAWPYHNEKSEPFLGKFIDTINRKNIFVATKLPAWKIERSDDMYEYLDKQLERLHTTYIDYYLLHSLGKKTWNKLKENNVFEFMNKLRKGDRVRNIGFSFHDKYGLFREIIESYDWDFCQIQYNYMDINYQAGMRGLKYAFKKGLDIIIMEPLRGGMLTKNVPEDIQEIWEESGYERTPAEWGLRWVWNHPEVNVVLSGMSDIEHVKENVRVANNVMQNSMSDKELEIINRVREAYGGKIKVDCTLCRYCMPCPSGVDIPQIFEFYNDAFIYNQFDRMKRFYNDFLDDSKKASKCIECGECEEKCPQGIPIIEQLKEVREAFEE